MPEKDFLKKIKKETPIQVFFCKFCEIFKNTFFTEHHWTTGSRSLVSEYCILTELLNKVAALKDFRRVPNREFQSQR